MEQIKCDIFASPRTVLITMSDLHATAIEAKELAYAPYSNFRVGCALKTKNGTYKGANIENASFGAGVCAERSACINARMAGDTSEILELAIVSDGVSVVSPCGICRQFLREFGLSMKVHMYALSGECETRTLDELLPMSFGPDHLRWL